MSKGKGRIYEKPDPINISLRNKQKSRMEQASKSQEAAKEGMSNIQKTLIPKGKKGKEEGDGENTKELLDKMKNDYDNKLSSLASGFSNSAEDMRNHMNNMGDRMGALGESNKNIGEAMGRMSDRYENAFKNLRENANKPKGEPGNPGGTKGAPSWEGTQFTANTSGKRKAYGGDPLAIDMPTVSGESLVVNPNTAATAAAAAVVIPPDESKKGADTSISGKDSWVKVEITSGGQEWRPWDKYYQMNQVPGGDLTRKRWKRQPGVSKNVKLRDAFSKVDNSRFTEEYVQNYIDKAVAKYPRNKRHLDKAPFDGSMLLDMANKHNFPMELLLAQGYESIFGTAGRGVKTKNIYNVGNVTEGDKLSPELAEALGYNRYMESWEAGVMTYMDVIKRIYLPENGDWTILLGDNSFRTRYKGKRYMDAFGEKTLRGRVERIQEEVKNK